MGLTEHTDRIFKRVDGSCAPLNEQVEAEDSKVRLCVGFVCLRFAAQQIGFAQFSGQPWRARKHL